MKNWNSNNGNQKKPVFGLQIRKKDNNSNQRSEIGKPNVFNSADDDDDMNVNINGGSKGDLTKKKQPTSASSFASLAAHRTSQLHEEALKQDPSVFQYDEVFESAKATSSSSTSSSSSSFVKNASSIPAKRPAAPKYIENLLSAAKLRKLERERVVERKVQKDREAEEAAGLEPTEKFVTSAYREKMKELEVYEMEQNRLEQLEKKRKVDFTSFYKDLINQGIGFAGSHAAAAEQSNELKESDLAKEISFKSREEETASASASSTFKVNDSNSASVPVHHQLAPPSPSIPLPTTSLINVSIDREEEEEEKVKVDRQKVAQSAKERYLARKKAAAADASTATSLPPSSN